MKTPIEYIKEAFAIYTKKENFIFFAKVMAVLVIISSVIGYVMGYFFADTSYTTLQNIDYSNIPMTVSFVLLTLLSIFVGIWSQTTSYMAILKIGKNEKEIFELGYKNMWRYFLISFVLGLIILLGIILLIIPAVIFGIWYSFSFYLVLDKNMGIKESLIKSKEMVKGKFWKVLGRNIVFGLFSFIVTALVTSIPQIGPLLVSFTAPLFMLPGYLLYRDLISSN